MECGGRTPVHNTCDLEDCHIVSTRTVWYDWKVGRTRYVSGISTQPFTSFDPKDANKEFQTQFLLIEKVSVPVMICTDKDKHEREKNDAVYS